MKIERMSFWGVLIVIFFWGSMGGAVVNFPTSHTLPQSPVPQIQGSIPNLQNIFTTKVTSTDDFPDANLNDNGVCNDGTDKCTLRAAIQTVNAGGTKTTIVLEAGKVYNLTTDRLEIKKSVTIEVAGDGRATIATTVDNGMLFVPDAGGVSLNLKNLNLLGGQMENGAGGCIYFGGDSDGILNLDNVILGFCTAESRGGALFVSNGTVNIKNSTFFSNKSGSGEGGAAIFENGATTTIENSVITECTAPNGSGGGLVVASGSLTLKDSTLSKNNSKNTGGALLVKSGGVVNILNSSIFQNSANGVGGGAIRVGQQATVTIQSSTISQNNGKNGGGLHLAKPQQGQGNPSVNLENTILAGNTATDAGPDCALQAGSTAALTSNGFNLLGDVTACPINSKSTDITSNDPGLGDPIVVAGSPRVLPLKPDSPAVDSGNPGDCPGTDGVDELGKARPQPTGGNCDIGAFELEVAAVAATPTIGPGAGQPTGGVQGDNGATGSSPTPSPTSGAGAEPAKGCSLATNGIPTGLTFYLSWLILPLGYWVRRIFGVR